MTEDTGALYRAFASRDSRFDGVFYIGVTSTGIYCRPVCPAKTPKPANCRFFRSAEAAEKENFRPCLRCRPELAPGTAPVDEAHRIANLIATRIDEGMLDDGASVERIAARFGWSSRQIRRIVQRELGVSPIELVQTRRLLLAKQLLTETDLPMARVAFGSGFSSLRRFNDAWIGRYGMPPTRFRRAASRGSGALRTADSVTLKLGYRSPFDWTSMLAFLEARALPGVERVSDGTYLRTLRLGTHRGWIRVRHQPERRALLVDLAQSLTPVLPALLGRLRHAFDLTARPDVIAGHLSRDPILSDAVARRPGLRVPGGLDGFELAWRAIVGQQITVKAATKVAGRLVEALGESLETPHDGLVRLGPTPARIAGTQEKDIAGLGVIRARALSIIALAEAMADGRIELEPGADPEATIEKLLEVPGIGRWTAEYIAMRALRWPDAFPEGDVAVRNRLGGVTVARARAWSEGWRPWRSYATLHLWQSRP